MRDEPLRSIHVGTGGRGVWPIDVVVADPNWEPYDVHLYKERHLVLPWWMSMKLSSKTHAKKQDWRNPLASQVLKK